MKTYEMLTKYLNEISSAVDCLYEDRQGEQEVNEMLFHHMQKRALFEMISFDEHTYNDFRSYLKTYFQRQIHYTMSDKFKMQRVKSLASDLVQRIDLIGCHRKLHNRMRSPEYIAVRFLTNGENFILAKERYDTVLRFGEVGVHKHIYAAMSKIDFSTYVKVLSATQISDLASVSCMNLKKDLLLYYIQDSISAILKTILNEFVALGLTSSSYFDYCGSNHLMAIKTIFNICSSSQSNSTFDLKLSDDSAEQILLKHCRKYPYTGTQLLDFLGELRKELAIYPSACNKKKFAAIAYILYKGQHSIGLIRNSFKSYSKFKQLLASYYGMEDSSFKPKDLGTTIAELKKERVFNKVTEDK